jgi:Domain of unknown function (DUF4331)
MSSHREAPEIASDPVADNTDVYAFVSPDAPDTVTLIANFIPGQDPAGGPNFYRFGDSVLYSINISNSPGANADISFQFRFKTDIQSQTTFLYNTGPIMSLTDPNWNLRQLYSVTRVQGDQTDVLGTNLSAPPCRIGPRSTPKYDDLANAAIHTLPGGIKVFAGQRADPFWVDLGSIFDLGDLRPFQNLHLIPSSAANGVNELQGFNVHTIAIQVPINQLTSTGAKPGGVMDPNATLGVWATANRQQSRVWNMGSAPSDMGPWIQVSRLGNPLVNEVLIPLWSKDLWNQTPVNGDSQFVQYYQMPELQKLLPVLYPGVFPNLAALNMPRADLVAILLTGIPTGVVPGFQNYTGSTQADMLRLNVAVPPSAQPNPIGLLAGDAAGFPNGRRLVDDVVSIELRAIAGVTLPLVAPNYKPDDAAGQLKDGTTPSPTSPFLPKFPYVGTPYEGYVHQHAAA